MLQFLKSFIINNLILVPTWLIARYFINIYSKKNRRYTYTKREVLLLLFVIYVASVASITIIPLPEFERQVVVSRHINLIPFATTVKSFVNISSDTQPSVTIISACENFFGNIIMFMPLGIFLPLLNNKYHNFKKLVLTGALCSVSIEAIQFISMSFKVYRYVDIDDVILNTTGAAIGYVIYKRLSRTSYALVQS